MTSEKAKPSSVKTSAGREEKKPSAQAAVSKKVPNIKAGNVVRVYQKLKEGDKERTQIFEGIVIAKSGKTELDRTITVRKVCEGGWGVERIFPVSSPLIEKIEVTKTPRVRRSKLYYLRQSPRKMRELLTK